MLSTKEADGLGEPVCLGKYAPTIGRPKRHVTMLLPVGICHIIMTYNGGWNP